MARTWLLALVAASSTMACLWPEPPQYREPEQTKPILWGAFPTTTQIQSVNSNDQFSISVKLTSEDAGEDLLAFLYLNYLAGGLGANDSLKQKRIPAGSYADDRTIEFNWTVVQRSTPGTCEQLTLIVGHESSFDTSFVLIDDDFDQLTWWLDINGTEQTVAECGGGAL